MTDTLWAPWRMKWIAQASKAPRAAKSRGASAVAGRKGATHEAGASKAQRDCLFCRVAKAGSDRRDLVLARRPHAMLMLNRYPYASAHLMVAVNRHAARFLDLEGAERSDLLDLVALAERALEVEYEPHGVNYGLNAGRVAGAGFPGHLHLHLVPRWDGDTNFMPVVARTRVLPESLAATWGRLRRAIARLERPRGGGRRGPAR
ncbi:MAG TPA: HIT domain-containing protein [Methylomirabilota bacterium]|nr:HIT domain-containing protein [Methylomirabilota bacterium]